ncbi:MAG: hypothetical protein SGILL_000963 [Bacillariaceae sp.]
MKSVKTLLTITALMPAASVAFGVAPVRSTAVTATTSALALAKGFGKEEEMPQKVVRSEGQAERERASSQYDKIAASGGQEYAVFVRQFGGDDESWLPCGSIAVNRGEQVSNAIFGNEEPLKSSIVRMYPKLKGFEQEFEYGYNLKVYPDEPVEVASKSNAASGPSLGNWMSNLLSPIDASNVQKS